MNLRRIIVRLSIALCAAGIALFLTTVLFMPGTGHSASIAAIPCEMPLTGCETGDCAIARVCCGAAVEARRLVVQHPAPIALASGERPIPFDRLATRSTRPEVPPPRDAALV